MITYHSTRGSNSTLSFKDVVLSGVADDKGLYLPNGTTLENLSNLTQEDLSYEDFVKTIFIALDKNSANYLDDLSIYSGFENSPEPVLREIENNKYVMELFHGPTKSFHHQTILKKRYFVISLLHLRLMLQLFHFVIDYKMMMYLPLNHKSISLN